MPTMTTVPAHAFEAMKRVTANGNFDDALCGYVHHIDDENGVFCVEPASHSVHSGTDLQVRVGDWTGEEDEN